MEFDAESAILAFAGVLVALPFIISGFGATLGGTAGLTLIVGPLLGGVVAGYARGNTASLGFKAGAFAGLYLTAVFTAQLVWVHGLDPMLLATGFDYWVNGEPVIETIGAAPERVNISIAAVSLSRFYYPVFFWSLTLGPLGGLFGGYLRG